MAVSVFRFHQLSHLILVASDSFPLILGSSRRLRNFIPKVMKSGIDKELMASRRDDDDENSNGKKGEEMCFVLNENKKKTPHQQDDIVLTLVRLHLVRPLLLSSSGRRRNRPEITIVRVRQTNYTRDSFVHPVEYKRYKPIPECKFSKRLATI